VSPTALVLGVFAEVLRAWSASPSFTLVLTYFNRPPLHAQIREMVGPAISSLLFVVDEQEAGDDFGAIVRAHHRQLWQNLEHSSLNGIQALRRQRGRGREMPPKLPVVFTSMLGSEMKSESLPHLGEMAYMVNQTPQVYLDHQVRESSEGLEYSWDVAEGYFAAGLVKALFTAYGEVLEGLADGRLGWNVASFARPASIAPTALAAIPSDLATNRQVITHLSGFLNETQQEDPLAPFSLTDQQQAYAFGRDTRFEGGGASCQLYQQLHVSRLDVARLEQVLALLIARHPMLRTVVEADGSQSVLAHAPRCEIEVEDLRQYDAGARQAALAERRDALLDRVVPLGKWSPFAVHVSRLEGEAACVHLCFDLLLVDSTSIGVLLGELIELYERPRAQLPELGLTFRAYQRAVERFKSTADYAGHLGYWTRRFADLPGGPQLPLLEQQASEVGEGSGIAVDAHQRLDGELKQWPMLKQQASARGIEVGLVLLTAYLEVLYAWNEGQPLTVVVPGWERLAVHPDIEGVVGDFTTLSWVTRESQVLSFEARLARVAQQHAQDLARRPVSGLQALRRVMRRGGAQQLTFPVVFTNQITRRSLPGGEFTLGEALSRTAQVYLDNLSSEAGDSLHCNWDFAGGIYAPAMVEEMFAAYLRLLAYLGSDPAAWRRSDFSELIQARPAVYSACELAMSA